MSIDHKDIIINALTFQLASIMELVNDNQPTTYTRQDQPATHEHVKPDLERKVRQLEAELEAARALTAAAGIEFQLLANFFVHVRSGLSRELSQYIINQCSDAIHNTPTPRESGHDVLWYLEHHLPVGSAASKDYHRARLLMAYSEDNQ